jgi:hypothetical protein
MVNVKNMRKLKLASITFLGMLLFFGCTKKQDLNIDMNVIQDGDLRLRIVNASGTGIADVDVKLYDGYYSSPLEQAITDADGYVSFKDILSGSYLFRADDVPVGALTYNISQDVQVIAGIQKEYTLNATDYSGSVTIEVINDYDYTPIVGINVGLFKMDDYINGMDYTQLMDIVFSTMVTDEAGKVTFSSIPLDTYGIVVYIDETLYHMYSSFSITTMGEEAEYYVYYYMY